MKIENLTIMGTGFTQTQPVGSCGRAALYGIFFNGAGGSVNNVTVTGITEGSNCQVGRAIVGMGTAGQTLTITGTTVSDYNKDAMHAYGMTMNISDSTIEAPASLKGVTGQNGLVYQDGATGTTSDSTITGSGYGADNQANVAVLLFAATNVTLRGNTITGAGTDIGVDVAADSTGAIIDRNQIGRTAPDAPTFSVSEWRWTRQVDRDVDLQHLQRLEDRHHRCHPSTVRDDQFAARRHRMSRLPVHHPGRHQRHPAVRLVGGLGRKVAARLDALVVGGDQRHPDHGGDLPLHRASG